MSKRLVNILVFIMLLAFTGQVFAISMPNCHKNMNASSMKSQSSEQHGSDCTDMEMQSKAPKEEASDCCSDNGLCQMSSCFVSVAILIAKLPIASKNNQRNSVFFYTQAINATALKSLYKPPIIS